MIRMKAALHNVRRRDVILGGVAWSLLMVARRVIALPDSPSEAGNGRSVSSTQIKQIVAARNLIGEP